MEENNNNFFIRTTDPLSHDWPLISSPFPLMFIIFGYLYFVLYAGPNYMKNRPPYKLKSFISFYNSTQILMNLWLIKEHVASGWISKNLGLCSAIWSSSDEIRLISCAWWVMLLKIFDLVETFVFVLRKKENQVSKLHVYHHVSNIFFVWIYLKYIAEEKATIISLINCAVHVIMYIYYFIAAKGPKYQKIISPFKPYITKMQMVQFVVIIILMFNAWNPNCKSKIQNPHFISIIFIGNILIILYLFYDFYKKTYINKKSKN